MKKLILLFLVSVFVFSCLDENSRNGNTVQDALSGSYATLLTVGDFLYAINESELTTFDIKDSSNPIMIDKQDVGFNIENIYHSEGVLFIGSQNALHIFVIEENGVPKRKSETTYFASEEITSCDPVIVSGDYAYVTLSTTLLNNGPCARRVRVNEMRIYEVSNIENPKFVSSTRLDIPKGLAIDGQYLFVCLEKTGLIVLDVTNKETPEVVTILEGFESYDVITKNGLLMVVCPKEIREYDYSDIKNIKYLNKIEL